MRDLLADLRHAARSLLRRPGFSLLVVATLGLGMAAVVAVFSLADAVLLRPLPFPDSERLVAVWETPPREPGERNVVSPANYLDWKAASTSFAHLGAWYVQPFTLAGAGEAVEVQGGVATPELFAATGLAPVAGSWPAVEDQAVVLSHALWQRRFAADPAVVASTLSLDGESFTVSGVAPAGLELLAPGVELWAATDLGFANRETMGRFLRVAGRLAPGVDAEAAGAELAGIAERLAREYPSFNAGWSAGLVPLDEQLLGDSRPVLRVLLLAAGLLLVIACANGANLLLTRGLAREREVAIRTSLGARRPHIVRQFLLESLLLSLAAAGVALLAATWVPSAVAALPEAARLPRAEQAGTDLRVLGIAVLVALATALAAGAAPALAASRRDPREALQEGGRNLGGRRGGRLRAGLVVTEVALSLVLLAGAGLMVRSLAALGEVDPGFESAGVVTARVPLSGAEYQEAARQAELVRRVGERLAALPGVEAAGAINYLPLSGIWSATGFWDAGKPQPGPQEEPGAGIRLVSPGYVETMGIPLLAGRDLADGDAVGARRVALVNRELAETMWPGQDPLGKRLTLSWTDDPTVEVVGVVGNVRHEALAERPDMEIYLPFGQGGATSSASFVVRTAQPAAVMPLLRDVVREVDPALAVADVQSVTDVVGSTVAAPRLQALLLAVFALAAVALSAVGLYGVLSQVVVARTGEIGVRMALGARRAQILRRMVVSGMLLVAVGLTLGLALSLATGRALEALLFEVGSTDPLVLAAAATLLALVSAAACLAPALRAAALDPLTALREE
ncbi:MAG TPA: ADOP family duplicated permease [Thermoanaerobaculia bacterium]|nr:ADOP family duplicated permease [Thermoanaerobaculia bacterium]